MKWRLTKYCGQWTVLTPKKSGSVLGYGFARWRDAADFLIEETK